MGKRGTPFGIALEEIADIVDELEDGGAEVVGVSTRTVSDQQGLHADLELRIPVDASDESVEITTTVDSDAASSDDGEPETEQSPDEVRVECSHEDCDAQFDTEHGMKIHHTKVHVSGAEAGDLPSHRDPGALREVYESHDSFTEMREALGTDVSAQTVRRQTIEHGIHDPGAADDAGADATEDDPDSGTVGDDSPPTTVADETPDDDAGDVGDARTADAGDAPDAVPSSDEEAIASPAEEELPGDLTVADVRDAVEDGSTLYEVQQALDLDREAARELLSRFDLLELVHGRVATQPDREARKTEIEDRIRANEGGGIESESD